MKYRHAIAWGLLALAAAARADVKVNFVNPDKFIDIKDNTGFADKDVLTQIEAHLVAQAQKFLPGQDVTINVTDIDLAGNVEPFGHSVQWVRVMRRVTLPAITLNYEVSQAGQVVRKGDARLRDMNYQDGVNSYFSGEPLRYEKHMIDRWFQDEFGTKVAAASPR
ncbi:DUF3016 domain-containing protein [Pelomonas cellulosilytica]|uniref:DUF3016 domain-containing protein n=1 Tax=Pelomonas cellulosilytica TaxID=2906762 RepID=A0ABS8Y3F5_9BURK|nr:DUF3016 domain-containing protein [Pelomonas sp. P8]MCE4557669.1 DUF3016 domain-containing protein [Pelomonas sp. P8]